MPCWLSDGSQPLFHRSLNCSASSAPSHPGCRESSLASGNARLHALSKSMCRLVLRKVTKRMCQDKFRQILFYFSVEQ